jgi:hypothetical protein
MSFLINTIATLISVIAGIVFYKRLQPKWVQHFFYFVLFCLLVDVGAHYYSAYFKKSNHFIINIYMIVCFAGYFLIFHKIAETKKMKLILYIFFSIYLLFSLYDIFFINGFYFFNSYSYSVGSILIIICCLLYFMRMLTSDNLINYFRIPAFWIVTGLLFYFAGNLVQMSLFSYILNNLDPGGKVYTMISVTLNIFLYGCFTISFICNHIWKKTR